MTGLLARLCGGVALLILIWPGRADAAPNEGSTDGRDRSPPRVERRTFAMGTAVTLAVRSADREHAVGALDRMLRELEETEAELSTWRDDSALSAVNRQPVGVPLAASSQLCELFAELASWHRDTDGAFDPAVGALIEAWGLRQGGRRPSLELLESARSRTGFVHIQASGPPCRITRQGDVSIDAGAFGKGAAIDRIAQVRIDVPWWIDLGGQMAAGGAEATWPLALAHPLRRDEPAVEIFLETGSIATSGGSVRDVEVDGAVVGHILDPRTGRPVSRNASAVVWHSHALVADILATALYVMGPEAGLAWAEERTLSACFLIPVGAEAVAVRATTAFRDRFLHSAEPVIGSGGVAGRAEGARRASRGTADAGTTFR